MKYKICKEITAHEIEGQTILVDPEGNVAVLNPMASNILEMANQGRTADQIRDFIVDNYRVEKRTAQRDVQMLFARLQEKALVCKTKE